MTLTHWVAVHPDEVVTWAVIIAACMPRRWPVRRILGVLWRRNVTGPLSGMFEAAVGAVVAKTVTPQLARLDFKIDDLSARNDDQHAENALAIANLRAELGAHVLANPGLPVKEVGT